VQLETAVTLELVMPTERELPAFRAELRAAVVVGLGRIIALYHRSSTSYKIR
jgi:hypothetical protein